ncbi:hypothetical protein HK096_003027 [Nowakowskiella sp. JEL0078]|nr:hypothetical protein HK096_003027 [Nowakowskiella sp. JEL0078]
MRLDYIDNKSDEIKVAATGTGGLEEFISTLDPSSASFGYIRVVVGNDELSQRAKFVFVAWCGSEVRLIMRKAKFSIHIGEVQKVVASFAVDIRASTLDDLNVDEIQLSIKKAMGANYDRQASEY